MRIARAPLRITLGGGGTDLPGFYEKHGGFLIAGAINTYIYMTCSRRPFDNKFWLSYSKLEVTGSAGEINHELFRNSLQRYTFPGGVELHSISEVPGNSGLGSSGSFLVCLLTLLNSFSKREETRHQVATMASHIEMNELKKACGKQDHFIAAFGGIISMEIDTSGQVTVTDLPIDREHVKLLQNNLLIYHTGFSREADTILKQQTRNLQADQTLAVRAMKRIKEIGYESRDCLLRGALDDFGHLLHEHWVVKRDMQSDMSNPEIDRIYEAARQAGMLGGKIMGAGGGGFFMFYVPPEKHVSFRARMRALNLTELDWRFSFEGCEVLFAN